MIRTEPESRWLEWGLPIRCGPSEWGLFKSFPALKTWDWDPLGFFRLTRFYPRSISAVGMAGVRTTSLQAYAVAYRELSNFTNIG